MRILIVHNPKSGFGSDSIFAFERALVHAGDECLLRVLAGGNDAHMAVADAEAFDLVVLSGGDGTVASLLYELRGRNVMTCIFPSGTANLLFANIGNAPEPAALARTCRVGHTTPTDLGEMDWVDAEGNGHVRGFALMAGTGFDAELMQAAIPNKQAMGQVAYFMAALSDPHPKVIRFSIEVDGTIVERDGIACIVANNAMMQGDIQIIPDSRMDDGLLDVIVLETSDAAQLLRPLFAGLVDRSGENLGRPRIESFHGADITVTCSQSIPMQLDGDVVAGSVASYHAHVLPSSNRIVVDGMSRYAPSSDDEPLFPGTEEVMFP